MSAYLLEPNKASPHQELREAQVELQRAKEQLRAEREEILGCSGQRVCYAQRHRPKTPSRLKRERESHREKHQEKIQDLHMAWFWRVATRGFKFLAAVGQDLHVQLHAERKALTEAHDSNRTEHQQLLVCQQLTGTGRAYDL